MPDPHSTFPPSLRRIKDNGPNKFAQKLKQPWGRLVWWVHNGVSIFNSLPPTPLGCEPGVYAEAGEGAGCVCVCVCVYEREREIMRSWFDGESALTPSTSYSTHTCWGRRREVHIKLSLLTPGSSRCAVSAQAVCLEPGASVLASVQGECEERHIFFHCCLPSPTTRHVCAAYNRLNRRLKAWSVDQLFQHHPETC